MSPLLFLLSIASFTLGIVAITLFSLVFLEHRARIVKYYILFITNISVFPLIDIVYAYLLNYYKVVPYEISIIFWILIFIFSSLLMYSYIVLIWILLKLKYELLIKRIVKFISIFVIIIGAVPFCIGNTSREILHLQEFLSQAIVDPLEFIYGLFVFITLVKNYNKADLPLIRTIIRANIVMIIFSIVFLVTVNFITTHVFFNVNLSSYAYFEFIYLLWNIVSIIYFFSFAKKSSAKSFEPSDTEKITFNRAERILSETLKKYEKSGMSDNEVTESFSILLAYMREKKPYLDPEISLESLSIQTNIPKHHLSRIINQVKKCNFYDFLSEYRIEEFKNILSKEHDITILEAAFEAGFNSKAAFYTAFKKNTGMTPLEFSKNLKKSALWGLAR